jgi:hypothetical protein
MSETESMIGRAHEVVFATLLLVVQLLFGAMSSGAMAHNNAQHCGGCLDSGGMSHDIGTHGGTPSPNDHGTLGCGSNCVMGTGGHCGSPASPVLAVVTWPLSGTDTDLFGTDHPVVTLPDSPLFDLLRPPTRA